MLNEVGSGSACRRSASTAQICRAPCHLNIRENRAGASLTFSSRPPRTTPAASCAGPAQANVGQQGRGREPRPDLQRLDASLQGRGGRVIHRCCYCNYRRAVPRPAPRREPTSRRADEPTSRRADDPTTPVARAAAATPADLHARRQEQSLHHERGPARLHKERAQDTLPVQG